MWPGPEGLLTASPGQAVSLHHFTVLLRIQCGWLWHAPCSVAVTTLALPCSSNSSVLSHTEHTLFFCLEGPPCLTPLFLVINLSFLQVSAPVATSGKRSVTLRCR